jgi:hypothetical protein
MTNWLSRPLKLSFKVAEACRLAVLLSGICRDCTILLREAMKHKERKIIESWTIQDRDAQLDIVRVGVSRKGVKTNLHEIDSNFADKF